MKIFGWFEVTISLLIWNGDWLGSALYLPVLLLQIFRSCLASELATAEVLFWNQSEQLKVTFIGNSVD